MCGHAREREACSSIIGGLFLTVIHVFIQVHQDLPPPGLSVGGVLLPKGLCAHPVLPGRHTQSTAVVPA